jgi:hypothetical protein
LTHSGASSVFEHSIRCRHRSPASRRDSLAATEPALQHGRPSPAIGRRRCAKMQTGRATSVTRTCIFLPRVRSLRSPAASYPARALLIARTHLL